MKAFDTDDDGTFKKFSHKKHITCELYNVYCSDVAEMIQMLPKEYTLLIGDIPYGFRMAGFTTRNQSSSNNYRKW